MVVKSIRWYHTSIDKIKGPPWLIKSQIHAGGRGAGYFLRSDNKKGGIRLVNNINELKKEVSFMLGNKLVTKHTRKSGKIVRTVYIEEGCSVKKEFYLSLLIDRETSKIMLLVSDSGGINIEEIAINKPEKIYKYYFEKNKYYKNDLTDITKKLLLNPLQAKEFNLIVNKLFKVFIILDVSTI